MSKIKILLLIILVSIQGIIMAQPPNIKFEHISLEDGLSQSSIYSIVQDNKGFMWFATLDGLNKYDGYSISIYRNNPTDSNSISDNVLNYLYVDPPKNGGKLWIATYGGGINVFNPETGRFEIYQNSDNKNSLSNDNVTTVFKDHLGIIWVGTFGGGLNRWNKKNKSFIRYQHNPKNEKSIGNNRIYAITEDSKGRLWIGTKGSLSLYNREKDEFENFGEDDNFPNNVMMGILEDHHGYIWVSTNSGLSKFNPETKKVRNYDIRDRLQSNEFLVGSFCKTNKGLLIFDGVVILIRLTIFWFLA